MYPPLAAVPISAVIVACNEEARIRAAIDSVSPWVDEVLVLDGGSHDRTVEIASLAGARVCMHPWDGYVTQKQRATDLAAHPWVFSLDADERVDAELGAGLKGTASRLAAEDATSARVTRVNYLDGRAIVGSGWGRDVRVRLFDRRKVAWGGSNPHDRILCDAVGPILPGSLDHDPDRTTRTYVRGTVRHARVKAKSIAARGRPGASTPWLRGAAHWFRKAITAGLDGRRGWTIAWVGAKGTMRAYRLARRTRQ
jgi:(heptosyl)LPS beta-1,4-glucosyltransferase